MKQTNSAIKFLMAQYRAIFNNAYFKGLATATVATMALAASQAQAAAASPITQDQATAGELVVSEDKSEDLAQLENYVKSLTVNKGATLTLNNTGTGTHANLSSTTADITVNGKLILSGSATHNVQLMGGTYDTDKSKNTITQKFVGTDAEVTLDKGTISVSQFNMSGGRLTLTGGDTNSSSSSADEGFIESNIYAYGTGLVMQDLKAGTVINKDADLNLNNVEFTINKNSTVGALDGLSIVNSKVVMNGGDEHHWAQLVSSLRGDAENLQITNSSLEVKGDNNIILSPKTVIENSDKKVSIAKGATLTFKGRSSVNSGKTDVALKSEIDNQGTLNLGVAETVALTNAKLTNSGTVNFGTSGGSSVASTVTVTNSTVANTGTINLFGSLNVDSLNGFYGIGDTATGTLKIAGATVTVSGADQIDLSKAKITGDTKSSLVAEKSTVIVADGFENKAANIQAGTLKISPTTTDDKSFTQSGGSLVALNALTSAGEANVKKLTVSGASSANTTFTLGAASNGAITKIAEIEVKGADASNKGTLNVEGKWDFGGALLSAGEHSETNIKAGAIASNISALKVGASSTINVAGTATIDRLLGSETGDAGPINVTGTLNIKGDGKTDKQTDGTYVNDVQHTTAQFNINAGGTLALTTQDAWDDVLKVTSGDGFSTFEVQTATSDDFGAWTANKVALNAGGTLKIDLSGYTVENKAALDTLTTALAADAKGIVDFGGLNIKTVDTNKDGTLDYDKMPSAKTDATKNLAVNITDTQAGAGVKGSMGSANVAGETLKTAQDSTLEFNNAKGGQFATNTTEGATDKTVNVTLASGSALKLNGNGSLGDIKADASVTDAAVVLGANNGTQSVGEISVATLNVVGGNVTAGAVTTTGASTINGSLTLKDAQGKLAALSTNGGTIAGSLKAGTVKSTDALVVSGKLEATDITSADLSVVGDVVANSLALSADTNAVTVGSESASGSLELKTINLSGGSLIIDPAYGEQASVASLTDKADVEDIAHVGLGGSVGVGQNSILAIAMTKDEAKSTLSSLGYLQNGSLVKDKVGSAIVLNQGLEVASGAAIYVDNEGTTDTLKKAITNSGLNGSGGLFDLGANTALVVTGSLYDKAQGVTDGIIKFADTQNTPTLQLAQGSNVVFNVTDALAGDQVKLTNAATVTNNGANIIVDNQLLDGTLDTNGTVTFKYNAKGEKALTNVSAPVKGLVIDIMKNGKDKYDRDDSGVAFIAAMNTHNGGQDIEGAARLAVYGGAVQGTALAQQAANDAVVERMSRSNPNGSLVFANNAQGGGLWLSPIYKSHESDSFDADGVDYGVDGDLTGLVLGADSTTASGVRVGGYFNFGSASFDGQGVGSQVSNDADYFGFGLYAGMTFGQFSLLADAGFTQVSNDIEQSVNYKDYSKVKADVDSTAVTLGLRGEYKLSVATMDVTPHLGVRYTRLNIDSYDAKSNGDVLANTSFDTMQMFSIPFGVSVSKDIAAGAWTIKPVFDLTLTANAGDTDAKMNTTFIGARSLDLTSEAFDSFTYGATFGLDAKYGENFSIGLNTNYTGSSNADEFGVMGNVRYMF